MKVLCIDLKSFYASVECILRGLDPFSVSLAVTDKKRGDGAIVLAVSPYLKSLGAKSRCRVYDLKKYPDVIYAKPRMLTYMEYACKIYEVYLQYLAPQDIYIYSIDEAFLDVSPYLNYYKLSANELARKLLKSIYQKTNLVATCGMGDNMFQAKVALDCFAKTSASGLAILDSSNFVAKTKDLQPISQIWGIGEGIKKSLHTLHIHSLGDIIRCDRQKLLDKFGIIGQELYEHAHGRDNTLVSEARNYQTKNKSFGYSQIMFEDYNIKDMYIVLCEYVDTLATELIIKQKQCQVISLGIAYNKEYRKGFTRQIKLSSPTNSRSLLLSHFTDLYYKNIENFPIRMIGIRASNLVSEKFHQNSLFTNSIKEEKEHALFKTLGLLQTKYGLGIINMSTSYLPKATKIKRSTLLGGHNAQA